MLRRVKSRRRMLLLLPALLAGPMLSQGRTHADDLDTFIQTGMQAQHVPGLVLAVVQDGKVVREKGYGLADVERAVPVTTDTVFEIGSVTKQYTATAIMMLVDGGKVGLDDKINRYVDGLPDAWKDVTIRQLLSHTSGIPDYEAIMGYSGYRNIMTPAQVIALAASRPMDFAPGTRWNYSNTGYYLLTMALEKVTGHPYIDFAQANILGPLGMTHTHASDPQEIIPDRAAGYSYENGRLQNRDPIQPSATGGAGMIVSTVGDLVKWEAETFAPTLLHKEDYALMRSDTPLADGTPSGYGFGWFVSPMHGHRAWEHSGGTAGFTCETLCLPDDHLAIIVLSNLYASGLAARVMTRCAHRYVSALIYRPIPDLSPQVTATLRDLLAHMATDPDVYTAPLSPAAVALLKPDWPAFKAIFRKRGPVQSITLAEHGGTVEMPAYRYRVRFSTVARLYLITLDKAGKIANFDGRDDD